MLHLTFILQEKKFSEFKLNWKKLFNFCWHFNLISSCNKNNNLLSLHLFNPGIPLFSLTIIGLLSTYVETATCMPINHDLKPHRCWAKYGQDICWNIKRAGLKLGYHNAYFVILVSSWLVTDACKKWNGWVYLLY